MKWNRLRVEIEAKEGKKKIEQSFTVLLLVGNDYMQQANSMSEARGGSFAISRLTW